MNPQTQPAAAQKTANPLVKKQMTIKDFLQKNKSIITAALPKHLDADRIMRIVMTEIRKTPKLLECDKESLFSAVIQASQLGLEPGGALGQAYLIPYGKVCQFIVGYRGMIDLMRRSGSLISIGAHCVYENDLFEFEYGLNERLRHIPTRKDRGEFIGAYSVVKLKDGGTHIEVMWKNEIDEVRKRSKASGSGPWVTDYPEMAKKTVVRRQSKYLPMSIELAKAVQLDEQADRGEIQDTDFLEGECEVITTPQETSKADKIADKLSKEPLTKEGEDCDAAKGFFNT